MLDGPVSCGKSIALALLVHWACDEGWLVLYAPRGREWTHGGFFYRNPETGLWDTPVQAENVLKARTFSLCQLKVFYAPITARSKTRRTYNLISQNKEISLSFLLHTQY